MFGFGKKKNFEEAKKLAKKVAEAAAADIDAFIRDQVVPARQAYLSVMVENLNFDASGEVSPTDIGSEHFGAMMQEWVKGAYTNFQRAGDQFCAPFEENGLDDIAVAVRLRLNRELDQQSYQLACDGIEAVREAIASHRGDPPLNGEGMDSIRKIVRLMGDPNAQIDWNAVLAG